MVSYAFIYMHAYVPIVSWLPAPTYMVSYVTYSLLCICLELGGIPVLVVTQGIDFIPVLFFRIPVYRF